LKWISSFPGNVGRGKARASALLVLNETDGGRPEIVLEGSIISARRTAASAAEVFAACPLVSLATTAGRPHIDDLSACPPGAAILHVSLRDLAPQVIVACDNVVDDADHVCRAQTSLHLAEQATGGRGFIRCALAEILAGKAPARRGDGAVAVFSPFGLGVLDVALGKLVAESARAAGRGTAVDSFFPALAAPTSFRET